MATKTGVIVFPIVLAAALANVKQRRDVASLMSDAASTLRGGCCCAVVVGAAARFLWRPAGRGSQLACVCVCCRCGLQLIILASLPAGSLAATIIADAAIATTVLPGRRSLLLLLLLLLLSLLLL